MGIANLQTTLDSILRCQPISRNELSEKLGTSSATITRAVNELIRRRLIKECHDTQITTRLGRPPRTLMVNDDYPVIVAITIERVHTNIGLINLAGQTADTCSFDTEASRGAQDFVKRLGQNTKNLFAANALSPKRVLGIGLGLPGDADKSSGMAHLKVSLGWPDIPLASMIQNECGIVTWAGNRVEMAGLAEYYFGVAKQARDFWYFFIGDGIGAAHIHDGQLHSGANGCAGEIGHIALIPNGPPCRCGKSGCLEPIISKPALLSEVRRHTGSQSMSLRDFFGTMRHDNAAPIFRSLTDNLALACSIILLLNDPEMLVLAGDVIDESGDMVIRTVCEKVRAAMQPKADGVERIVIGSLGDKAALLGAASLVYGGLFSYSGSDAKE